MEEKTIIAIIAIVLVAALQIIAWFFGFNGTVSQLVGMVFGAVITYYFTKSAKKEPENPQN